MAQDDGLAAEALLLVVEKGYLLGGAGREVLRTRDHSHPACVAGRDPATVTLEGMPEVFTHIQQRQTSRDRLRGMRLEGHEGHWGDLDARVRDPRQIL